MILRELRTYGSPCKRPLLQALELMAARSLASVVLAQLGVVAALQLLGAGGELTPPGYLTTCALTVLAPGILFALVLCVAYRSGARPASGGEVYDRR